MTMLISKAAELDPLGLGFLVPSKSIKSKICPFVPPVTFVLQYAHQIAPISRGNNLITPGDTVPDWLNVDLLKEPTLPDASGTNA
jgi:hypothetical protein